MTLSKKEVVSKFIVIELNTIQSLSNGFQSLKGPYYQNNLFL